MKHFTLLFALIVLATICLSPAPASAEKREMTELSVEDPSIGKFEGDVWIKSGVADTLNNKEVIVLSDGQVIDPDDLPEVQVFVDHDQLVVVARSPYRMTGSSKAEIIRNGIGPIEINAPELAQMSDGPERWFYKTEEGADYARSTGSLVQGRYIYTLYLPYRDTGLEVKYETERFDVRKYEMWADACLTDNGTVHIRVFMLSLGRLPDNIWISVDGRTEHRVTVLEIGESFGLSDLPNVRRETYDTRYLLDVRTPDDYEVHIVMPRHPLPCHGGGGKG